MTEFLDELARSMAKPMPRRRALRLLGGALVSVAVPGIATTKARAASASCRAGEIVCKCACKGDKCTDCTGPICLVNCCRSDLGEYCDCAGHAGCWVKPCSKPCPSGTKCCGDDEFCANSLQKLCCKRGQRGCDLECCEPNEECRKIRVGTASKDICTKRCPPNRAWCGRDNCCPPKWKCINERTGLCKRCWPEEEECGKKCCDKKTSRCCGKAGCCPKNRACCNIGKEQKCCPAGQKCAIPILGGDIGIKPGTKVVCCPTARFSENPKLCCPPGQVALNTPGFRTPPPGISPFCCPPSLICGSGTSKICANLQGDSQNCGGCGNVCESGICNGGICALP
jgi:hypothetical protein